MILVPQKSSNLGECGTGRSVSHAFEFVQTQYICQRWSRPPDSLLDVDNRGSDKAINFFGATVSLCGYLSCDHTRTSTSMVPLINYTVFHSRSGYLLRQLFIAQVPLLETVRTVARVCRYPGGYSASALEVPCDIFSIFPLIISPDYNRLQSCVIGGGFKVLVSAFDGDPDCYPHLSFAHAAGMCQWGKGLKGRRFNWIGCSSRMFSEGPASTRVMKDPRTIETLVSRYPARC